MAAYKNVVIALELNEKNDQAIVDRAKNLCGNTNYFLIHAVEHLGNFGGAYGISAGFDVEEILTKEAENAMNKSSQQFNIPKANCITKIGPAKFVILEEAEAVNADLIICGSHGRNGLRLLLGSTANAILHGAKCDVLAVRVSD